MLSEQPRFTDPIETVLIGSSVATWFHGHPSVLSTVDIAPTIDIVQVSLAPLVALF